jgi:hypothetical protein
VRLGASLTQTGTLRLANGAAVTGLDGFEGGACWVQDEAASLPVKLLGDVAGLTVLDLCAAPGGKTMQLAARGARVTALDSDEERLTRVRENLARTGLSAEIVCADARQWRPEKLFDAVLLDAPCTATGWGGQQRGRGGGQGPDGGLIAPRCRRRRRLCVGWRVRRGHCFGVRCRHPRRRGPPGRRGCPAPPSPALRAALPARRRHRGRHRRGRLGPLRSRAGGRAPGPLSPGRTALLPGEPARPAAAALLDAGRGDGGGGVGRAGHARRAGSRPWSACPATGSRRRRSP